MKPVQLTLHPSSALAGAFLLALCLVTLGAFTPQGSSGARDVNLTSVLGQPSPHDNISIFQGTPFTVPNDKQFVLTSLGSTEDVGQSVYLLFDNSIRAAVWGDTSYSGGSVKRMPDFVIAQPGSVITVHMGENHAVATGYLIDA